MSTHLLTIAIFINALSQVAAAPDAVRQLAEGEVVPVSEWVRELRSISVAFRPKTEIDREDETPGFIEKVGKSLDGKVLKATGTVRSLQWKDDIGFLEVDVAGVGKADRLVLRFNAPIAVKMDKETAKAFRAGQSFELRAVVHFIAGANGKTHSKNAQHLANVTSNGATKLPWIGAFATRVYEMKVAGKAYKGTQQTNP